MSKTNKKILLRDLKKEVMDYCILMHLRLVAVQCAIPCESSLTMALI